MTTTADNRPDAGNGGSRWWTSSLGILLTAVSVFVVGVFLRADPDLWGHVRFGQLALELGYLPRIDPYSFLSRPAGWINHEWLSEIVFAAGFDAMGTAGLSVLPAAVAAGIVGGGFAHLRDRGLEATRAVVLSLLTFLGLLVGGAVVRPHLFTFVAFFVVALAIHRYERDRHVLSVGLLPLLFPVWAAFHGGFLAGLGLLALAAAGAAWRWLAAGGEASGDALRSTGVYAICLLSSAALTGLGPYGYELPLFLLETATVPRPGITEWQPVELRSVAGAIYLALAGATFYAAVWKRHAWSHVEAVVASVLVLLPLTAVRHVPLLALGFLVFVAPKLGADPRAATGLGRPGLRRALAAGNVAVAALLFWGSTSELGCIEYRVRGEEPETAYPRSGVRAVAGLEDITRLAVHFNWGEYVIWHLGPIVRVSMDGRRETVYSDSIYHLNGSLMEGTGHWRENIQRVRPDAALYPTDIPADNLLQVSDRWRIAHRDSVAALYVPSSRPAAERGGEPGPEVPTDGTACFPR